MDLSTFYAVVAATCFTLVGLWWNVVERHREWATDPRARRHAGGVYLSFLLPGMMSVLAQIDPQEPLLWRGSFLLAGLVGLISTVGLMRVDRGRRVGGFARNRWVVAALYLVVIALALAPSLARALSLEPLQLGGLLLVLLVAVAHALTWEFMLEDDSAAA